MNNVLGGYSYAFVYQGALFVKVFREGEGVVSEAAYLALGVTEEGYREVLGFCPRSQARAGATCSLSSRSEG